MHHQDDFLCVIEIDLFYILASGQSKVNVGKKTITAKSSSKNTRDTQLRYVN